MIGKGVKFIYLDSGDEESDDDREYDSGDEESDDDRGYDSGDEESDVDREYYGQMKSLMMKMKNMIGGLIGGGIRTHQIYLLKMMSLYI